MKNSCPQWNSNPRSFAYKANTLCVELLELINIDHLKVNLFYLSFLCKLPAPSCWCNNALSCIFLILYLYRFAVWLIKTFAECKELLKCITPQNILLDLQRGTGTTINSTLRLKVVTFRWSICISSNSLTLSAFAS